MKSKNIPARVRCYVFDIDGTIADLSHRLHHIKTPGQKKNWRAFFAACIHDQPIPHVIELAHKLWATTQIVFVSGRSDEVRMETEAWLTTIGFGYLGERSVRHLYMRKSGDYRADDIVKGELLDQLIADGFDPIMAFDDRRRVVDMWRARGIPCAQVAEGDF